MKTGFNFKIAVLKTYLVTSQYDIDKIPKLKGTYTMPEMNGATAKACYIHNATTGESAIVVCYPDMIKHEAIAVTSTLVHEACHVWDFNKDHWGYGNDTELHAYAVESIFNGLYEIYAKMYRRNLIED
ncbi:hypothetical protein FDJ62_gp24 [Acinetobacter phage Loki]|uniref:Uncharacterized protein n=1 Tax=Acinetobacter phage Loki TaxID=1970374 RepID=A0A0P1KL78_9CAUD|nr:hypothetical protein FDJ62_gp24 [Acinetobacter phage Loki]CUS06485.1 hypothetical protein [Acinetobacter phage Loki]